MSTFEIAMQESGRFEVVDAHDRPYTVIEYTEIFHRISVSKTYPSKLGGLKYATEDGTAVLHSSKGFFYTPDKSRRFFVVRRVELPDGDC